MSNQVKGVRVLLKNVRISYANLLEPYQFEGEAEPKYRCDVLISKDDTANVDKVKNAIKEAISEGLNDNSCFGGKDLKALQKAGKWHNPLKDGDSNKAEDPAYHNCYYLSLRSEKAPAIVDIKKQFITKDTPDADKLVYSGEYVHISCTFKAFNAMGNYGISSFLGNVVVLEKGDKLAGGPSVLDEFSDVFDEASNDTSALSGLEPNDDLI